jgi:hypothetical protein
MRAAQIYMRRSTALIPEGMQWRGINGEPCTWMGVADAAGRPDGHGVLAYPANHEIECAEGAMAAGRRQGAWITKFRSGTWLLVQWITYNGDDPQPGSHKVHPTTTPSHAPLPLCPLAEGVRMRGGKGLLPSQHHRAPGPPLRACLRCQWAGPQACSLPLRGEDEGSLNSSYAAGLRRAPASPPQGPCDGLLPAHPGPPPSGPFAAPSAAPTPFPALSAARTALSRQPASTASGPPFPRHFLS